MALQTDSKARMSLCVCVPACMPTHRSDFALILPIHLLSEMSI